MAKKKYSVETPYGTFTRSTDRTYTHIVLVCGRHSDFWARYYEPSYRQKELARYEQVVATGILPAGYSCKLEDYERWVVELKADLASRPAKQAAAEAKNAEMIANESYHCETWCGRYDLAVKAAAKLRKDYYLVKIVEVPAV